MGYEASASTVFGFPVTEDDFFVDAPGSWTCDLGHSYPNNPPKFCPECGGAVRHRKSRVAFVAFGNYAHTFNLTAEALWQRWQEKDYIPGEPAVYECPSVNDCENRTGRALALGFPLNEVGLYSPRDTPTMTPLTHLNELVERLLPVMTELVILERCPREPGVYLTLRGSY